MTNDQRETKLAIRAMIADYKGHLWPTALMYDDWTLSVIVGEITPGAGGFRGPRAPRTTQDGRQPELV